MINIPTEFKNILSINEKLSAIVMKTVSDFSDIICHSQFEFFPEYTDHKIDHLNKVLETALYLSDDSGIDLLTPEDICTLVLSTLLHDIGMHLTHEGFLSLIEGDYPGRIVHSFDSLTWGGIWHSYINELKKLSGKELINIFGLEFEVKELPKNKELLTRLDRKVIGEFIRRHHPRLAHEIALFGFPTKHLEVIMFAPELEDGLKDIIGVVARSHGMNIRDTFSYLETKFYKAWRNPRNVKCIYHMVLLRIADYLHITSERAPQIYLNTNKISSTISRVEWDLHKAVKEINYELPDKETLFVIAEPADSLEFLKLKKRFTDIQYEVDTSWAILGEVYNFMNNYRDLGIKIRRVQSNLDNVKEFSRTVSYLPREVRCESSPDLIKLLIAPLYGDSPSFGVRELLQNSIDACRERKICEDKLNNPYEPLVKIEICTENEISYFKISDNGSGMNEDVIVNYFLKAGSSFRDSRYWRAQYLKDNGQSIVQRSGRFGVGVYAGFLIGENIKVKTRHINEEQSYKFDVNLKQEQIEVKVSIDKQDIGTDICIEITNSIIEVFKEQLKNGSRYRESAWFEWYRLSDVKVEITIPKEWDAFRTRIENVALIERDDEKQHVLFPNGYNEAHWTYDYYLSDYLSQNLICNGIIIPEGYRLKGYDFPKFDKTNAPLLMVSDYDGHLPLTLDRNKIYGDLPFKELLIRDICKDILAAQLMLTTLNFDSHGNYKIINNYLEHNALCNESYSFPAIEEADLLFFKEGFCLAHSHNIDKLGLSKVSKIWINNLGESFLDKESMLNGVIFTERKPNAISDYKNIIDNFHLSVDKHYIISGKQIIINKEKYKYLLERDRMRAGFKKEVVEKKVGKNIVLLEVGDTGSNEIDFELFDKNHEKFHLFCEYFVGSKIERSNVDQNDLEDIFTSVLEEFMDDRILIPYDLRERRETHSRAFNGLSSYSKKYN
ncbi:ATP-binding protein [Paenibacillus chitinolyticus]|uniref:HD domain-containing protein n=1 Tax=Paenibacillus chitinolyticus TaxID=79263 RepID=UPI0035E0D3FF